jgi:hypothetical protein
MPKYRVRRHEVTQPQDKSIRLIPLTQNFNAIVDAADYDWLNQWNWCVKWSVDRFYVCRRGEDGKIIKMHRFILGVKKGEYVDHRSGDPLDNRRANIRKCTLSENNCNRAMSRKNTSGFTGVWFEKRRNKWIAEICHSHGKKVYLGQFDSPEEAAKAHDEAAKQLHGEFACINHA